MINNLFVMNKSMNNRPNVNELKNKILVFIRQHGPSLPIQVSRVLANNTILAGALLSELLANKLIRITKSKVGGSPLYYLPGQESKLVMLRNYLPQRPKQAFDLINEHKVLKDNELEPWQRVAIREIPDFAKPFNYKNELFWRWYLVNEQDTLKEIENRLKPIITEKPKTEPVLTEPKPEAKKKLKTEEPSIKKPKLSKTKILFKEKVLKFFDDNGIKMVNELDVSKKTDLCFKILIKTQLGEMQCVAFAKNKKKLTEDDIHIAYAFNAHNCLPLIVFAKDIGKKALETANRLGIIFKKF